MGERFEQFLKVGEQQQVNMLKTIDEQKEQIQSLTEANEEWKAVRDALTKERDELIVALDNCGIANDQNMKIIEKVRELAEKWNNTSLNDPRNTTMFATGESHGLVYCGAVLKDLLTRRVEKDNECSPSAHPSIQKANREEGDDG